MKEINDNITVFIRIKPPSQKENEYQQTIHYQTDEENQQELILKANNDQRHFTFDHIFMPNSTQEEVFTKITDTITKFCLQGNHQFASV